MPNIPLPVTHPLGPAQVSGGDVTIDMYSKQPLRVTRLVEDLTLGRFLLDRLFTRSNQVTNGAVIYDEVTSNDRYALRDAEAVAPMEEFPLLTFDRPTPKVAVPTKWGGKWAVSDEARDRNDQIAFMNATRKTGNTLVRRTDSYAVAVLEAAVTANSRTTAGTSWSAAVPNGATPTAPANTPFGNIAAARAAAIGDELGVEYNLLIVNQAQELSLLNFAQYDTGKLRDTLGAIGITDYFVSPRVAAGSAYLAAEGQVGGYLPEKPLGTESWREAALQATWFQTDTRVVAFVTNPFAVLKLTGIA